MKKNGNEMKKRIKKAISVLKRRALPLLVAATMMTGTLDCAGIKSCIVKAEGTKSEADDKTVCSDDISTPGCVDNMGVEVFCDNEHVEIIEMNATQIRQLEARGVDSSYKGKWQIMIDSSWVDIYDMQDTLCEINAAILENAIDENGRTALRYVAANDDETVISNTVDVILVDELIENTKEEQGDELRKPGISDRQDKTDENVLPAPSFSALLPGIDYLDDNNEEYVEITIHYNLEQENRIVEIFEPYVARLHIGSSFTANVPSPSYVGYTPAYNREGDYSSPSCEATTVNIDYSNLQSNQRIDIWYRPALVSYSSHYFLQNVINDLYTEDSSLVIEDKALTGSYPNQAIDIEIPGFTALFHEPDVVAADSSTEFHCYYDRNYYLFKFDCNGGFGVEPVYARYGTTLIVNNPTKPGYKFVGWDKMDENGQYDNKKDELPKTIGIENETYRALWETVNASYTVVFWGQNADNDDYSYLASKEYFATSGSSITDYSQYKLEDGYTKLAENTATTTYEAAYYKYNATKTNSVNGSSVQIEGNGTSVVQVYYDRKDYTIRYCYARTNGNGYYISTDISNATFGNNNTWGQKINSIPDVPNSKTEVINGYTYYYLEVTARYGSNIQAQWPTSMPTVESQTRFIITFDLKYDWCGWGAEGDTGYRKNNATANVMGPYPIMSSDMIKNPEDSIAQRMTALWGVNINLYIWNSMEIKQHTYNNYFEVLPGQTYDITKNGKQYKKEVLKFQAAHQSSTTFNPYKYNGFVCLDKGVQGNKDTVTNDFYYDRGTYTLSFVSGTDKIDVANNVPYQQELKKYRTESENAVVYPSTFEQNAYEFAGWYLTPECIGEPVDFSTTTLTMPDSDVTFYAKWEPIYHKVTFSNTMSEMKAGQYIQVAGSQNGQFDVLHREKVPTGNIPTPSSVSLGTGNYNFQGWFYLDNVTGEKKAFDMTEMPVAEDMNFFAEWRSTDVVEYTVSYVDRNSKTTIGSQTKGYSYAAMTKTFTAKAGVELNDGYTSHYYPTTNSHSILMDKNNDNNVFTFEYIYKEKVNYTVKYIDKNTGVEIASEKTSETTNSVVTEKFKAINGYVPDGFYKRLVLSADDSQNVLIFYYTEDNEHSIYVVKHKIEELDGTYTEYASIEGIADINTVLPVQQPLSIMGFEYDQTKTRQVNSSAITVSSGGVSGNVGENGLEMDIIYKRNVYNYTINFLEYGSDVAIKNPVMASAKYGTVITIGSDIIDEVVFSSDGAKYDVMDNKERTLTVRDGAHVNIYYQTKKVTFNYIRICNYPGAGKDFGQVSLPMETVKNIRNVSGSTANPAEGFSFVGWYTDPACTIPVESSWVNSETGTIIPGEMPSEENVYYYALFEPTRVEGIVTIEGTYKKANGSVQKIFDADRRKEIQIELQKKNSEDVYETVATRNVAITYIDDLGIGRYELFPIVGNGDDYRVIVNEPNYNETYQNIVTVSEDSYDFETYNENDNTPYFGDDILSTFVNVHLSFSPVIFDLDYSVDASSIESSFRPEAVEVLMLYDDLQSGDNPQNWPVISQMETGVAGMFNGQAVTLNNGTGSGSYPVWAYRVGTTPYDNAIKLSKYTYNGVEYDINSAPFIVEYNGSAHYDKEINGSDKGLTATLVPKKYAIVYNMNAEGEAITNMDEHQNDTYSWSVEYQLTAEPMRDKYKFVGWSASEDGTDIIDLINAGTTGQVTLYAVWEYDVDNEGDWLPVQGDTQTSINIPVTFDYLGADEVLTVDGKVEYYDATSLTKTYEIKGNDDGITLLGEHILYTGNLTEVKIAFVDSDKEAKAVDPIKVIGDAKNGTYDEQFAKAINTVESQKDKSVEINTESIRTLNKYNYFVIKVANKNITTYIPIKVTIDAGDIDVEGFQMNTSASAGSVSEFSPSFRAILSTSKILEASDGSLHGIKKYGTVYAQKADVSDFENEMMIYDDPKNIAKNSNVSHFECAKGTVLNLPYISGSENSNELFYALTIKMKTYSYASLQTDFVFRAYAVLDNDEIVYSDKIEGKDNSINIYNVAENLYENKLMSNESAHKFLYDNVLNLVSLYNNRAAIGKAMLAALGNPVKGSENYNLVNNGYKDIAYYTHAQSREVNGVEIGYTYQERNEMGIGFFAKSVDNSQLLAILNSAKESSCSTLEEWIYDNTNLLYEKVEFPYENTLVSFD